MCCPRYSASQECHVQDLQEKETMSQESPEHNIPLLHPQEDYHYQLWLIQLKGARCSSVVRAFAHGAMGRRIDPSWGGPIELFLIQASAP